MNSHNPGNAASGPAPTALLTSMAKRMTIVWADAVLVTLVDSRALAKMDGLSR